MSHEYFYGEAGPHVEPAKPEDIEQVLSHIRDLIPAETIFTGEKIELTPVKNITISNIQKDFFIKDDKTVELTHLTTEKHNPKTGTTQKDEWTFSTLPSIHRYVSLVDPRRPLAPRERSKSLGFQKSSGLSEVSRDECQEMAYLLNQTSRRQTTP